MKATRESEMNRGSNHGRFTERHSVSARPLMVLPILALVSSLLVGCGVVSGGKQDVLTFLKPPLQNIDAAELAANLQDGQGMYLESSLDSKLPGRDLTASGNEMTAEAALAFMEMGAAKNVEDAWAVFDTLAKKNRQVVTKLVIAESAVIGAGWLSDNDSRIEGASQDWTFSDNVATNEFLVRLIPDGEPDPEPPPPIVVPTPEPTPDDPDPITPPPIPAPMAGLWKPQSDTRAGSVILLPTRLTGQASKVEVNSTTGGHHGVYDAAGNANGGRDHFRHNATGNDWNRGKPIHITVTLANGTVAKWTVAEPTKRYELK